LTKRGTRDAFWKRLPRWAYWTVGAAVSFVGAFTAKIVADQFPLEQRLPFWITGTAIIFVGLWVLSMGTKSRLDKIEQQENDVD
jgi:cytochrome c biogenesis protein CcdA